ncbi:hypothetical protein [Verrucomicrobium sp. BvORR034]|uniref:Spy/CpxP family protein refolding chaperone n=1 Tax=Verrucomicrobium sp. BvORR034 TaxID=1396418 RepID=UPI0022410314|nr:hypothetical protein [Verrucomicrobium sp. BvORR034]
MRSALSRLMAGTVAAVILSSIPAPAADPGKTPALPSTNTLATKARQELEVMMDKLKLSDVQKTQVRPVFEDALVRSNALLQSALKNLSGNKSSEQKAAALEQSKQELKSIKEDTDTRLTQILTPEQMAQMKKLRNERGSELKKEYPVKKPS